MLLILYAGVTLWALFSIIMHGTRPTKSLGWVLTVFVFPFAGPLLYYLFGVNRRKFKFFRLKRTEERKLYDTTYRELESSEEDASFDNPRLKRLSKLIKNSTWLAPYPGNEITLLNGGEDTFETIFQAIGDAKKFVHLQYYIFEKGELQDRFYELFKKKTDEGVEIRLLYDSFGSFSFRGKQKKRFLEIGVKAIPIMPLRFGNLLFTLNYRNHRKIIIVDGVVGFTGGVNVSDKYIKSEGDLGKWEDLHVQIKGPAVNSLHKIFIKDYHFASDEELLLNPEYIPEIASSGKSTVQIVASGPDSAQPAILQQYVAMINNAEDEICIANPYFIPGVAVLEALKIATLSGITVRLLIPRNSDSFLAKYSMYANFEGLLEVGVHIHLREDFSHSKVIVVDRQVSSIGSGNFDHRSFEHNFETNALIYDEEIAEAIMREFDKHCDSAKKLSYDHFKERAKAQKFLEGVAKFFSPLL